MKKENLYLIIGAVFMLVLSLLVILIVNNYIPKDPKDYLFNQVTVLDNKIELEEVPNTSSYAVVHYKEDAFDRSEKLIGTVYNIKIKNSYGISGPNDTDGYIELLVGITPDQLVYVEIVTLVQSSWTVKGIQAYIYNQYQGVLYTTIPSIASYDAADLEAGVTATDSTGTIKTLIQRAVDIHYDLIVDDPFMAMYGEGYVLSSDQTFVASQYVVGKQIVKNSSNVEIGYIYRLSGSGAYDNGYELVTGSIDLEVAFNLDDEVLGVVVPMDDYDHSDGSRYNKIVDYVESFIGLTVDAFPSAQVDDGDLTAGVTYSKTLLDTLLDALVDEVN